VRVTVAMWERKGEGSSRREGRKERKEEKRETADGERCLSGGCGHKVPEQEFGRTITWSMEKKGVASLMQGPEALLKRLHGRHGPFLPKKKARQKTAILRRDDDMRREYMRRNAQSFESLRWTEEQSSDSANNYPTAELLRSPAAACDMYGPVQTCGWPLVNASPQGLAAPS
jgi:hypothetical protein